jgi:hypothetical protein
MLGECAICTCGRQSQMVERLGKYQTISQYTSNTLMIVSRRIDPQTLVTGPRVEDLESRSVDRRGLPSDMLSNMVV